ncbi:MAG: hypothetical protein JSV50_04410 [Desulfobacteraceae bacterium]|nr:MAG: hypothetical protein JSV50_04410 [Desulfobacteraceae bacterium]
MKDLIIEVYKRKDDKPNTVITIPIATLHIGVRFIPKKIKSFFEAEGIDIQQSREFTKEKDLKGTIIQVENTNERVVISVE